MGLVEGWRVFRIYLNDARRFLQWERQHEKALRAELAAKRAAAAQPAPVLEDQPKEEALSQGSEPAAGAEENGKKRRRRTEGVDYIALNKMLEQEAAAKANEQATPAADGKE